MLSQYVSKIVLQGAMGCARSHTYISVAFCVDDASTLHCQARQSIALQALAPTMLHHCKLLHRVQVIHILSALTPSSTLEAIVHQGVPE